MILLSLHLWEALVGVGALVEQVGIDVALGTAGCIVAWWLRPNAGSFGHNRFGCLIHVCVWFGSIALLIWAFDDALFYLSASVSTSLTVPPETVMIRATAAIIMLATLVMFALFMLRRLVRR